MEFLSIRDFSASPRKTKETLKRSGKIVLTNNGKPSMLVLDIAEGSFEKTLSILQKVEFLQNLTDMRLISLKKGNSNMTLDEINSEIKSSRKTRRIRSKK
jgi:hypothetical protein